MNEQEVDGRSQESEVFNLLEGQDPTPFIEVRLPNGMLLTTFIGESSQIREIFVWNVYGQKYKVKEGDVVIDVGANVGAFTLKVASEGASRVIALEPHPFCFGILVNNIFRNALRNVTALNLGLANDSGVAKLYLSESMGGHSFVIAEKKEDFIHSRVTTLDDLMERESIRHVDFLKVDAEGFELGVLQGSRKSLQWIDNIVLAAYHFKNQLDDLRRFFLPMKNRYKIWIYDGGLQKGGRFLYASRK